MLPPDINSRLAVLASLQDPVRRALYLFVLSEDRTVSRDEAAAAVDIRRGLAAFHLDRLAEEGLLEVEYRRLTGRSGPGAGRPAKLYRPAPLDFEVSFPPRSYVLVGELLAEAVEASRPGGSGASAEEIAEARGRALGRATRESVGSRPTVRDLQVAFAELLARLGYQPDAETRTIRLRNCPFHALAEGHRPLVCGMNEAFVRGVVEGLGLKRVEARLDPSPGQCCVVVAPPAASRG